ncbi:MAG: PIN domain-containing protein [Rhizobiales bacterium]|nr:PIN domain-containing protein [Hyphomicrobiales bacterium]
MRPIRVESRAFVDSNVLLYTIDDDEAKALRAYEIMDEGPLISVQVLNEFTNVARKKFKLDWPDVRDGLEHIRECCEILPLNLGVHLRAIEIAEANRIGVYDACLVAAADLAGCDVLYTEDMNHGQRIGGVTLRNPFV